MAYYKHCLQTNNAMYYQYQEQQFCDCTFLLEGDESIKAHKSIVAMRSQFIRRALEPFPNRKLDSVNLRFASKRIMEHILNYMYLGTIEIIQQDAPQFIEVANTLEIYGKLVPPTLPNHFKFSYEPVIPTAISGTDVAEKMEQQQQQQQEQQHTPYLSPDAIEELIKNLNLPQTSVGKSFSEYISLRLGQNLNTARKDQSKREFLNSNPTMDVKLVPGGEPTKVSVTKRRGISKHNFVKCRDGEFLSYTVAQK